MPHHAEHFSPICTRCLLDVADVLLLALLAFLLVLSIRNRFRGGPRGRMRSRAEDSRNKYA